MLLAIVDDDHDLCDAIALWLKSFLKRRPDTKPIKFEHLSDGDALLAMLRKRKMNDPSKILVLLDLDLHGDKQAGVKALQKVKTSKSRRIREVPVVIYSNSDDPAEIEECYFKLANSYVWKGLPDKQKQRFLDLIGFWTETASVPALMQ